jgi:hypothetical protein
MGHALIAAVSAVALMIAFPLASNAQERERPGASRGDRLERDHERDHSSRIGREDRFRNNRERNGRDADHERNGRDDDRGMSGSSLPHERREAPVDGRDRDPGDRGSDRH